MLQNQAFPQRLIITNLLRFYLRLTCSTSSKRTYKSEATWLEQVVEPHLICLLLFKVRIGNDPAILGSGLNPLCFKTPDPSERTMSLPCTPPTQLFIGQYAVLRASRHKHVAKYGRNSLLFSVADFQVEGEGSTFQNRALLAQLSPDTQNCLPV